RSPSMRSPTAPLKEVHVALLGQSQVGKSAFILKYLTKRFIGEYDGTLEETYCKQESIDGEPVIVCLMDTVDCESGEWLRWQTWGDLFIVVYDITCSKSLSFAEKLLERNEQARAHTLSARAQDAAARKQNRFGAIQSSE
ncbi:hypothetical protein PFISCL1PPCAC_28830, partial [Pristionchus fissidentatus]